MTAATVGAERCRWRAASRVAIRTVTGKRAASRPTQTTSRSGMSRSGPTRRPNIPMTAARAEDLTTAKNTPTPPMTKSTRPRIGNLRLWGGETFWPFMTPTMSRRPSRSAGISAR